MTRAVRLSLVVLAVAVLLLASLLLWLFSARHAWLHDDVERVLAESLGREVRIDGELLVEFGLSSVVIVEGLRIDAPDWSAEGELLVLDRATAVIDTFSIVSDTVVIEALLVEGLTLAIETDEEHGANWQVERRSGADPTPPRALPLRIDDMRVTASGIRFRSPSIGRPLDIRIDSLEQAMAPDSSADLQLRGAVNDRPLDLKLRLASMVKLARLRDVAADIDAAIGEIEIAGTAVIDDLVAPRKPELHARITGPGAGYLGDLLQLPDLDTGDLALQLDVAPDGDQVRVDLDATVGLFHVTADAHFDDLQALDSARATLEATGPNAARFASLFGVAGLPAASYSLSATAGIDGSLVDIPDFAVTIGATDLRGTAHIPDFPSPLGARVDVHAEGPAIEAFGELSGLRERLRGPFDLDLDLSSAGSGRADLDARLQVAGAELTATGPVREDGASLTVSLAAEDAKALLQHLDLPGTRIPNEALRAAGSVDVGESGMTLSGMKITLGSTRATLTTLVAKPGPPATIDLRGTFEGPDAVAWVPALAGKLGASRDFALDADVHWVPGALEIRALKGHVGSVAVASSGTLTNRSDAPGMELEIHASTEDVSQWSASAGHELPAERAALDVVLGSMPNGLRARQLEARLGRNRVSGELSLWRGPDPRIEIHLDAGSLDLSAYLPTTADAAPDEDRPAAVAADGRLIADAPIPKIASWDHGVTATASISELALRNSRYRNVSIAGSAADGRIEINELSWQGERGARFSAHGKLVPATSGSALVVAIDGSGVKLGLPSTSPEEFAALPAYDVQLALTGSGASVRALAGSLHGYLRLEAGEGRIRTGSIRILSQDFVSQLMETINPFYKDDPHADVECLAAFATVDAGIISGNPILVGRSDKLQLMALGKINLGTEALDVDINTIARKGLGISIGDFVNPYLKVGGTLARPKLILDPKKGVVEGGAAVATGGLSILAKNLYGRFFSGRDPCGKLLEDTAEQFAGLRAEFEQRERADRDSTE